MARKASGKIPLAVEEIKVPRNREVPTKHDTALVGIVHIAYQHRKTCPRSRHSITFSHPFQQPRGHGYVVMRLFALWHITV